jgi:hypothetical protein
MTMHKVQELEMIMPFYAKLEVNMSFNAGARSDQTPFCAEARSNCVTYAGAGSDHVTL